MKVLLSYIRGIISDILIYLSMFILGIIGLPFSIVSKKYAYAFIRLYILSCFLILRVIANIRVECRGEVPQGNVLVCSKHMSFLDILILAYYLPRYSFVMKRELVWTPIIGVYALRIGCVPISRGAGSRALNKMIKNYDNAEDETEGKQIVIYPQGTRVRPKEFKKYKIGAGVLYQKFELPCHLVGTNTGMFWPKGSFRRNPGVAVIEFTGVLQPGLPFDNFMAEIETRIEKCSNNLMEEIENIRK